MKYERLGVRVTATKICRKLFPRPAFHSGMLLYVTRGGLWCVKRDGQMTPQLWHRDFWRKSPMPKADYNL